MGGNGWLTVTVILLVLRMYWALASPTTVTGTVKLPRLVFVYEQTTKVWEVEPSEGN